MYFDCLCSVAFPQGAVDWSAVCKWGISWSYSLIFFIFSKYLLDPNHTDLILLSSKQTILLFSWVSSPYDV